MANFAHCDEFYRVCTKPQTAAKNTLVVSINENVPYAYESPVGSSCFCGLSISLLREIASSIDVKYVLVSDKDPRLFRSSINGAPQDVQNGWANISVCPLSFTNYRLLQYDMIPVFQTRTYQLGLHKSHVKDTTLASVLDGIADSFDVNAWTGIVLISMVAFGVFWMIYTFDYVRQADLRHTKHVSWRALLRTYWEVIYISFNQEGFPRRVPTTSYYLLMVTWIFWILVISTIMTTSLTASLSTSFTSLPFDSQSSFIKSDFHIMSRPTDIFDPPSLSDLKSKRIEINTTSDARLMDIVVESPQRKSAVVCTNADNAACLYRDIIPAFDLGMYRWISVFQLPVKSKLTKTFSMRMMMLAQGGIPRHLSGLHGTMSNKGRLYSEPSRLTISTGTASTLQLPRLRRLFQIYLCSTGLSVFGFILEMHMKPRKNFC